MYINGLAANKYGLYEAVILQNFFFWISLNMKNNKYLKDGKFWTYASLKSLTQKYNFITENKIRSSIGKLIKLGIIIKGNYNTNRYNRTTWYAFKDEKVFNEIKNLFMEEIKTNREKRNPNITPLLEMLGVNETGDNKEDQMLGDEKKEAVSGSSKANESICEKHKSSKEINKNINNKKLYAEKEKQKGKDKIKLSGEEKGNLLKELLKRGMTKIQIMPILNNCDREYLNKKIEQFDFVTRCFPQRIKNIGRYMYMSIKSDWIDKDYEIMLKIKENKHKEELNIEIEREKSKISKEYEFYLENECIKEYESLTEKEKEEIDSQIKTELDKSSFLKSDELLYISSLEAKRVLYVMDRTRNKAMSFEAFAKKRHLNIVV